MEAAFPLERAPDRRRRDRAQLERRETLGVRGSTVPRSSFPVLRVPSQNAGTGNPERGTLPIIVLRGRARHRPAREHGISRRNIDPDALKVLYRLHEEGHTAYLVGGSVRDLLLGRRPKDFDIGTNAHPYQIKKLFRNCWIIGRRFRLAHIKFGAKTIEVATFRRVVEARRGRTRRRPKTEAVVVAASPAPTSRRIRSIATTRSARRKRTRSGATSRSTGCSTTSRRSRSSTTSAASPISSAGWCGRSAIRTCGSWRIPCACCARPSWPRVSASTSTRS